MACAFLHHAPATENQYGILIGALLLVGIFGFNFSGLNTTLHLQLVKEWQAVVSKDKDHQRLDYEDCTNSRHQKQWYELTVPLIHFGSDIVLVLIVGFATIYQLKRGDSTKYFFVWMIFQFCCYVFAGHFQRSCCCPFR